MCSADYREGSGCGVCVVIVDVRRDCERIRVDVGSGHKHFLCCAVECHDHVRDQVQRRHRYLRRLDLRCRMGVALRAHRHDVCVDRSGSLYFGRRCGPVDRHRRVHTYIGETRLNSRGRRCDCRLCERYVIVLDSQVADVPRSAAQRFDCRAERASGYGESDEDCLCRDSGCHVVDAGLRHGSSARFRVYCARIQILDLEVRAVGGFGECCRRTQIECCSANACGEDIHVRHALGEVRFLIHATVFIDCELKCLRRARICGLYRFHSDCRGIRVNLSGEVRLGLLYACELCHRNGCVGYEFADRRAVESRVGSCASVCFDCDLGSRYRERSASLEACGILRLVDREPDVDADRDASYGTGYSEYRGVGVVVFDRLSTGYFRRSGGYFYAARAGCVRTDIYYCLVDASGYRHGNGSSVCHRSADRRRRRRRHFAVEYGLGSEEIGDRQLHSADGCDVPRIARRHSDRRVG